jgi:3-oxoacyl-[acyl-carrier-protein] synthase-1
VGLGIGPSAAAVRASISMKAAHPYMVDKAGERMIVAADYLLSPELDLDGRMTELATTAILEACAPLGRQTTNDITMSCWLGLPSGRPGFEPARAAVLAARIAATTAEQGLSIGPVRTATVGHAGGLLALRAAASAVLEKRCDLALAVGVDSYMSPDTLEWLDEVGRLLSVENLFGFPPGEGAGACLVASSFATEKLGLREMAVLNGFGSAKEHALPSTEDVCTGLGLAAAIEQAASRPLTTGERFAEVYCDINGETYRSEEWGFALLRRQEWFVDPHAYLAPANFWGDVGASSGPLLVGLAAIAGLTGYASGPRALVWCGSDGGHRAAVAMLTASAARGEP